MNNAAASETTDAAVAKYSQVHPFERANLGRAPFRFTRFEVKTYCACPGAPVQPGSSCDYCGIGIMNVFWERSADGREFKVGCDCIERVYSDKNKASDLSRADHKLLADVAAAQRKHNRTVRQARDAVKTQGIDEVLADETNIAKLASLPHPFGFVNRDTKTPLTALDYAKFMRTQSGAAGRAKLLKMLTKLLAS